MAVARIVETGITPDEYDKIRERVRGGGETPAGAVFHVAALGSDGTIRIIDVWDSREQADQFAEQVAAARADLGIGGSGPPAIEYLEVHHVIG
jgi:hypothetical protein